MKTLSLTRHELIWETRAVTWDESNWEALKEHFSKRTNPYDALIYQGIKDITWDEAYKNFLQFHETYDCEIKIPVLYFTMEGQHLEPLGSLILDWIREDCYDADITDTNYADDYEEEWYNHDDDEDGEEE